MSTAMLKINIIPMMLPKNTAVIAISTPGDEDEFYAQLSKVLGPDGRPFFKYISLGMICDLCLKLNRKCVPAHVAISLPHFRSTADQDMAERLLGNNDDARRELAGVLSNSNRRYLFKDYVPALRALPEYVLQYALDVFFSSIDPGGGGAASDYAVGSLAHDNDNWVLLGMDRSAGADPNVIWNMIITHFLKLRANPKTARSLIVLFIEANMSYVEANRLRELLLQPRFAPVQVISRDSTKQDRAGIITTEESKRQMADDLEKTMKAERLVYWRDFVTQLSTQQEAKAEIETQLLAYRRDARPSKDPARTRPIITYSGKNGGNTRDDQCMALQIALNEGRKMRESHEFIDMCRAKHWRF